MSMEATWDLRAKSSPRSLCLYLASEQHWVGQQHDSASASSSGGGFGHNPFEAAASSSLSAPSGKGGTAPDGAVAAVFGTERGSLHYRTYAPPSSARNVRAGGLASSPTAMQKSRQAAAAPASGAGKLQVPLGTAGGGGGSGGSSRSGSSSVGNLPRGYFPMDLGTGSLPGSVVACIKVGGGGAGSTAVGHRQQPQQQHHQAAPVFLLLVDDNRGTPSLASSQPGAYQAHLVTIHQHGGSSFSMLTGSSPSNPSLPRMSCAAYHAPSGQVVYAAGRSVANLSPDLWERTVPPDAGSNKRGGGYRGLSSQRGSASSKQQQQHQHQHQHQQHPLGSGAAARSMIHFGPHSLAPSVLPSPGARSGQDGLAVTAKGRVAVVAVGNAFYAVAGHHQAAAETAAANAGGDHHTATQAAAGGRVAGGGGVGGPECVKMLSLQQSSQVHPVICLDVEDRSMEDDWSCLFLASGRECAVQDLYYGPPSNPGISCSKPRHGGSVTLMASPILAAATSWPWVAVLTSDGLISIRSPSCLAIPLRTVEVGTRPNDYFVLRTVPSPSSSPYYPWIVAISYSGEAKVLQCQPDTAQDLADRLMRHAIDAFGANGFPRAELAEAVGASFTATSYVGPEPSPLSRALLKQYLEAVLGLTDFEGGACSGWPTEYSARRQAAVGGGGEYRGTGHHHGTFATGAGSSSESGGAGRGGGTGGGAPPTVLSSATPSALLTCTALLCLVCSHLTPPSSHASLASRAAKACADEIGVVSADDAGISTAAVRVCELVADQLLREAAAAFSLLTGASSSSSASASSSAAPGRVHRGSQAALHTDYCEAAIWLFRSCGMHERAINVAHERLQQQGGHHRLAAAASQQRGGPLSAGADATAESGSGSGAAALTPSGSLASSPAAVGRGFWSQIKYESYTATHLSELWSSGRADGRRLVLQSPVAHRLLENNPRLGLSVFTASHPRNEGQWRVMLARDDPLADADAASQVVRLLKSVQPAVLYDGGGGTKSSSGGDGGAPLVASSSSVSCDSDDPQQALVRLSLPLESGRALAVTFLESAIGIATGRPSERDEFDALPPDEHFEEQVANFHDELSFLLLEGVIAERRDDENSKVMDDEDKGDGDGTALGKIYRSKLRRLLRWPLAKIRSEAFMNSLPGTFLEEKALLLGRLGRHEDALRILYRDLQSLDLALRYCDDLHQRQQAQQERVRQQQHQQQQQHGMYSDRHQDYSFEAASAAPGAEDNAYLPLVRVALMDSEDTERGTAAAIQVLALRRGAIDRAAALRLLPSDVPVSAVARPFLIPALVDSESQVRRLKVVSALLRARYLRLKDHLTAAQLKAQANLYVVPQLKRLKLGDPSLSSKGFRARTTATANPTMPEVVIVKHFFPRHLVIQAKVTNVHANSPTQQQQQQQQQPYDEQQLQQHQRNLLDIAFVVAESSEEAIQPLLQVPIPVLPYRMTGSAWCVLQAAPARMDGSTAQLACELRYTVQTAEHHVTAGTVVAGGVGGTNAIMAGATSPAAAGVSAGRTYVEELQDILVTRW